MDFEIGLVLLLSVAICSQGFIINTLKERFGAIQIQELRNSLENFFAAEIQEETYINEPRCREGSVSPNPTDCTRYLECTNGRTIERHCPPGLKYDSVGTCVIPEAADCGRGNLTSEASLCPERYGMFEYPEDCHKYVICEGGNPVIKNCPLHTVYSHPIGCVNGESCSRTLDNREASVNIEFKCEDPEGRYAHPGDCHKYVQCTNGRPVVWKCSEGQAFSLDQDRCIDSEEAGCTVDSESVNSTRLIETIVWFENREERESPICQLRNGKFPHPRDCTKYVECVNYRPEITRCPEGEAFNSYENACIDIESTDCIPPPIPPRRIKDNVAVVWECPAEGGDYPYAEDCTKFLRCTVQSMTLMSCKEGEVFNPWFGCIDGDDTECKGPRNCTDLPDSLQTDFKCPSPTGKFADFYDCSVYHECRGGVAYLRSCETGENFDHLSGECVEAENASCVFPCRSRNGVYAYPEDCKKYIQCTDNKPKVVSCPVDEAFSKTENLCVDIHRSGCDQEDADRNYLKQSAFECPRTDGVFPNIMNCSTFWECENNQPTLKTCGENQLFSTDALQCDEPNNVACSPYPSGKKVMCYFDNAERSIPLGNEREEAKQLVPEDMNPYLCTHIYYSSATLDANTLQIAPSMPDLDIRQQFYARITGLKKLNPELKVILTVGGWEDSADASKYTRLMSDPSNWNKFSTYAALYLLQFGFDGIEFDWEFPVARIPDSKIFDFKQKQEFTKFLTVLSTTIKKFKSSLILAIKVSGSERMAKFAYDVPAISSVVDFITVLAFIPPGVNQTTTEHPAPLHPDPSKTETTNDAESIMNYWKRMGAPKNKLILGIRTKGRSYRLMDPGVHAIHAPLNTMVPPEDISFVDVCNMVKPRHWTMILDKYAGPYMFREYTWVGYEDPKAVQQKAEFVLQKQFAGVALLGSISDDHDAVCCRTPNPLLKGAVYALARQGQGPASMGCPRMRGDPNW